MAFGQRRRPSPHGQALLAFRARAALGGGAEDDISCGIARRRLIGRMQRLEEGDQCRRFCRAEVLPVRRHVAAALNGLSNQLVLGEPHGPAVETRAALAAALADRVAVAALFRLELERTLSLQCGEAAELVVRYRVAAPRVHVRAPRRVPGEM